MTEAYFQGYMAGARGRPRLCVDPWNVQWLREWFRGYDDAMAEKPMDLAGSERA